MGSTVTTALTDKFDAIESTLNGVIFERPKEIKTATLALIAGKHHLSVGPPGTGKTLMVDTLVPLIDGVQDHYFRYLMTRFTAPPEIFGPPSLKALEQDIYRVSTHRKLPEARIGFLDELFKANSSILNAMLTLLNEGFFYNGPDVIECELNTLFAASNELPREPELAALWDRITFRHEISPLKEAVNRRKMLAARAIRAQVTFEPLITWEELQQAREEALKVTVTDETIDKLIELQDALKKEAIEPTDRRVNDCIPIIKATAWREGRMNTETEDLRHLRHVLWVDIKDQAAVSQAVLALANPLDKEALDLLELVEKLAGEAQQLMRDQDNEQKKKQKGVEIHGSLERVATDLEELEKKAVKGGKKSELIHEAQTRVSTVAKTLLRELFGIEAA